MIAAKVETIERETAVRYLEQNGGNRTMSQSHVADLMARQRRGEWKTNGDSIRFDTDGQLRDGQHRLEMVARTGAPIEVVVVRDIDPAAFITMDVGRKRSFADVLSINEEENFRPLAAAVSWTWRYLTNQMLKDGTHEQRLAILDSHPEIRDSVKTYLSIDQPTGASGFATTHVALHYLFSRVDGPAANDFFERFITGLRLENKNDPVSRLRGQVVSFAKARQRPSPVQVFMLVTHAWNRLRRGEEAKANFKLRDRRASRLSINGFSKDLLMPSDDGLLDDDDDEEEDV